MRIGWLTAIYRDKLCIPEVLLPQMKHVEYRYRQMPINLVVRCKGRKTDRLQKTTLI